jgi:hypothetical protein
MQSGSKIYKCYINKFIYHIISYIGMWGRADVAALMFLSICVSKHNEITIDNCSKLSKVWALCCGLIFARRDGVIEIHQTLVRVYG